MLRRSLYRFTPSFMEIMMPALSPSMESGSLVKWNTSIGTKITQGTSICSIQTDKAVVSFDHQMDDGYLAKIFAKEGEVIEVGKLIAILAEEEADVAKADEFKPKPGSLPGAAAPVAAAPLVAVAEAKPVATSSVVSDVSTFGTLSEAIAASGPAVGRIAREVGEEHLKAIRPSGKNGRFTKADVIELANSIEVKPIANAAPATSAPISVKTATKSAVVSVNPGRVYDFTVSDSRVLAKLMGRTSSKVAKA